MMERLQAAIDKARRVREGEIGQTSAPGAADRNIARSARQSIGASQVSESLAAEGGRGRPASLDATPGPAPGHAHPAGQVAAAEIRIARADPESLTENRVIAADPSDPRVETLRQLRSQVQTAVRRNGWHSLAITSAHQGAGKTLTAINLAISISQQVDQSVLLVDLDLMNPSVHSTLGMQVEAGVDGYLAGKLSLQEIVVSPGNPRMLVLPTFPVGGQSSELLSSPAMLGLLDEVRLTYPDRLLIFDLPPLLRNDDAMVFIPNADAALLIVEDGVTTRDDLQRSLRLLQGTTLLGTVLNKAR